MARIEWAKKLINNWFPFHAKNLVHIFEGVVKLAGFSDVSNVKSLVNRPEYRLRAGRYRVIYTVREDRAVTVILIEEGEGTR